MCIRDRYKKTKKSIEENLELLEEERDEEMRELLKEDLAEAKKQMPELEKELKLLLLPKDPNDEKNVFVEIRAGAGGDEAALFAADLFRMYSRFAERNRWKSELISVNESGIGGMKEVVFMISGQGAYSRLKYESGVHRVQRVPETESGGRIHTSTATVAITVAYTHLDVYKRQLFGSVMSFGSMGKASAPGQVSAKELSDVLWAIERAVE